MDTRYAEYEDIIEEVGGFGRYQKCLVALLIPVSIVSAFHHNIIHFKLMPDHWCAVPELANFSHGEQHRLIRPVVIQATNSGINGHQQRAVRDTCLMFDIDYQQVLNELRLPPVNQTKCHKKLSVKPCNRGWLYDRSQYWDSFVMKFDIVCENSHKFNVIPFIRTVGSICGTPLFGLIADLYGRKVSYISLQLTSLIASILSPIILQNYYIFLVCQFTIGLTYPYSHLIVCILIIEFQCPKDRAKSLAMVWIGLSLGATIHTIIIYLIPHWIWMTIFNIGLTIPLILVTLRWTPESLQWLIIKNKYNLVETTFKQIMQINNQLIDEDLLSMQVQKIGKPVTSDEPVDEEEILQAIILKESPLKRIHKLVIKFLKETTLFQTLFILSLSFVINFMSQHIFNKHRYVFAKQDILLNDIIWSSLRLLPILVTWFLIQRRTGRRLTNSLIISLIGVTVLSLWPTNTSEIRFWISLFGVMLNTGLFMTTCLLVIESSPTSFRCSALAATLSLARLAVMVITNIFNIDNYDIEWWCLAITAGIALITGFLATFLMETLRENMPQSFADSERLLNDMKYWTLAKRRCDLKSYVFKSLSKWSINEIDGLDNS